MRYSYIIAIDPSGNFEEGKGTTGICIMHSKTKDLLYTGTVKAKDYNSKEEYWHAHIDFLKKYTYLYKDSVIVMEDYTLNPKKALQQSHSKMETSKLIGVLQHTCAENKWHLKMQLPVEAKSRWPDSILVYKHIIKKVNRGHTTMTGKSLSKHEKDAIRHATHFNAFYNK